ncbi:hypothetical protein SEA_LEOPARD_58 [Mycobacterium phage Leopard]|uniref:Uncharacterized protein n=1 Tax=Mycobacterium phage Onyinye TaxID=2686235 RepID=A0A6B9LI00_9CAUD|nr:zinc-finger protease [Mycobacterium phage Onyinye]QHB37464.1 hypothetical protein SEA_ONYINYE_59 [Mycobacterium phage Onyinye]UOW92935.1 hypothetical protein SEA_LEOPARD_58 [Mycobacterium phage Leopard]WKW85221.1 hypothetical protein SEA_AIKOY__59 [Mycobacterium phage Aikoy]
MKRIALSFVIPALIVFGLYAIHETARAGADAIVYYEEGENTVLLQEFVDAVGMISSKYGTGDIVVTTAWMPAHVMAKANSQGIVVNRMWTYGIMDGDAMEAAGVEAGYHPGGCSAATATAIHEAAHVLDTRSYNEARYELIEKYGTGESLHGLLSGYSFNDDGTLNVPEALAEAFQAVECGVANATEQELWHMLAYW